MTTRITIRDQRRNILKDFMIESDELDGEAEIEPMNWKKLQLNGTLFMEYDSWRFPDRETCRTKFLGQSSETTAFRTSKLNSRGRLERPLKSEEKLMFSHDGYVYTLRIATMYGPVKNKERL